MLFLYIIIHIYLYMHMHFYIGWGKVGLQETVYSYIIIIY